VRAPFDIARSQKERIVEEGTQPRERRTNRRLTPAEHQCGTTHAAPVIERSQDAQQVQVEFRHVSAL
jgi:hypothetical protein